GRSVEGRDWVYPGRDGWFVAPLRQNLLTFFQWSVGGDQFSVHPCGAEFLGTAGRAECLGPAGERRGKEPGVVQREFRPLIGYVVLVEDRLYGADGLAGTAVDAFVRPDVQRTLTLVDAV